MSEDVHGLLEKYSHVRPAKESDNKTILEFLASQSMKAGKLVLDFARGPDFFEYVRVHSNHSVVFLILNDDQSIAGTGSLLFKTRSLGGKKAQVGYFCDLRMDPKASRKARVQWRRAYAEIVHHLRVKTSPSFCDSVFTAVLAENITALNSLTQKLKDIRYQPVVSYDAKSLITPLPSLRKYKPRFHRIDDNEDDSFKEFLRNECLAHTWAPLEHGGQPEWDYRARHLQSWQQGQTLVARGSGGQVVGCLKAWKDKSKALVAHSLPPHLKALGRSLVVLGRPAVGQGEPVEVLHISYFFIDRTLSSKLRKQLALSLLDELYRRSVVKKAHIVQWIPNPGDHDLEDLLAGRYLYVRTGGKLFEVFPGEETAPNEQIKSSDKEGLFYFDGTL